MTAPVALILAGLVAAGAALFVAYPFLRRGRHDEQERQRAPSPRLALFERRDRALAALKELEFDHRTGKISDDDYRALLGPLRREAAEALRLVADAETRSRPNARAKRRRQAVPVAAAKGRR